jgi:acetyl-CoA C-acetyltransferase
LLFRQSAVEWFSGLAKARSPLDKIKTLLKFKARFMQPVVGLERGLTDPIVNMNMGQTAEKLAHLFDVSREQADQYAVNSHLRLHRAQQEGYFEHELESAFSADGRVFSNDDGVRPDSSVEKLAKLKPVFEPPHGRVTAGNSSQITDGASWVILASEEAVERYQLKPRAVIRDSAWAALDPSIMGLGPVLAATELLKRHEHRLDDIDVWEINEAFAAQVLACTKAWESAEFCRDILQLDGPMGSMDMDRLNIDGGAIGLGHPVGASGNRIVLHLVNALHRLKKQRGIASQCIGGGQGGAMLIEKV